MTYANGEGLIATRIKTSSNFDSNNTKQNNELVLNSGASDHYAVITKLEDPAPVTWISISNYLVTWTTIVDVYQLIKTDDQTAASDVHARVNDVIGTIQSVPRLGDTSGTILDSSVISIGGPIKAWLSKDGPVWAKMEVYIEWKEEVPVTFS